MNLARIISSLKQEKRTQERLSHSDAAPQSPDYHAGFAAGLGVAISELAHKADQS